MNHSRRGGAIRRVLILTLLLCAFTSVGRELRAEATPVVAGAPPSLPAWLDGLSFNGYIQLWFRLYEGTQNGLQEPQTREPAAQEASGFSLRTASLAAEYNRPMYGLRIETRYQGQLMLSDGYIWLAIEKPYLTLKVGQMRVPGTYEQLVPERELDFPTRSLFTELATDYSLARHPWRNSNFYGYRGLGRDLGAQLYGEASLWRYLFYVGNGLGVNTGIGADEDPQTIRSNTYGAYLYATRHTLDFTRLAPALFDRALIRKLELGGHVSYNIHPNVVLGSDKRTVLDIKRLAWSTDLQVAVTPYLTLTGMYGQCFVLDDFDHDGKRDYECRGWEAKAVVAPVPGLFYVGFRVEGMSDMYAQSHSWNRRLYLEGDVSWRAYGSHLRLDFSYRHKTFNANAMKTEEADPFSDVMMLMIQAGF